MTDLNPDLNRYYKILGIASGASKSEVKQAYRILAKTWHPDRFPRDSPLRHQAEEKLKAINEAYHHLKNYQPEPGAATPQPPASSPVSKTSSSTWTASKTGSSKPNSSKPDSSKPGGSQTHVSTKATNAEKYYERAAELGRQGKYREALEELSGAIRLNPGYVKAYRYRGFVHSMLGFELGAEADLRKAKELEIQQSYTSAEPKSYSTYGDRWRNASSTSAASANTSSQQKASQPKSSAQTPSAQTPSAQTSSAQTPSAQTSSAHARSNPSAEASSPMPTSWTCGQTLTEHRAGVSAIALSRDGKLLVSASHDTTIKLWNVRTGKAFCTLSEHAAAVTAIALSVDGQLLVSSSEDQTLRFWHVKTGTLLRSLQGYGEVFTTLAMSPDRQLLVGCGHSGIVYYWKLNTNPITHGSYCHKTPVLSLALSADGQMVMSGSNHHRIDLHQGKSEEWLRTWIGHGAVITAIALNPVDHSFAAGSEDGTLQYWADQTTSSDDTSLLLAGHADTVRSLGFSPNGQLLASGSRDRTIRLWHPKSRQLLCTLTGHSREVTSLTFSANSQALFSSSLDHTIKLWQAQKT